MSATETAAGARAAETIRASGPETDRAAAPDQTGLAPFRARLDVIDDELVRLLGERFQICREVAVHKSRHEIPMMQPGRVEIVRARYLDGAAEVDLPREFTGELFDLMIAATCKAEDELMDEIAARREAETGAPTERHAGTADRVESAPAHRGQVA